AISRDEDLAILSVNSSKVPALSLAGGEPPSIGTQVFAIGSPQGLTNTFSGGEVSGLRNLESGTSMIQCTCPISPGSSGGPLINNNAEVVGITTAYLTKGQNLNFAVPASSIRRLLTLTRQPT